MNASQEPAAVLPAALCREGHWHGPTVLSTTWKTQGMQVWQDRFVSEHKG